MTDPLDSTQLTPAERALTDEIAGAARRDRRPRLRPDPVRHPEPRGTRRRRRGRRPRCRRYLGERLRASGADVDVWEPGARRGRTDHPLTPPEGIGFAGRPQLAARFAGTGGGQSLLLNGHIDVVTARAGGRLDARPVRPAGRRRPHRRPRLVRHEGRHRVDGRGGRGAGRAPARCAATSSVCTNTDEECGGWGALACARHGVSADFAIVPEPSGLEVWPACRGSATAPSRSPAAPATPSRSTRTSAAAARSTRSRRRSHLLAGVDRLRLDWRSRPESRHPLLPIARHRLHPARRRRRLDRHDPRAAPTLMLAVLVLPGQADAIGWTSERAGGGRGVPAPLVRRRSVAGRAPARRSTGTPR